MNKLLVPVAAIAILIPTGLSAHSHTIEKNGQVLANGMNHPAFALDEDGNLMSCEDNTLLPGFGPAWYGLETAHHGPDISGRGKGDGCYQIEGNLSPLDPLSDRNPAIK